MSEQPIECAKHDYLEAACILRYQLRLTLRDGAAHVGRPITTKTLPSKVELLIVDTGDNALVEIPMHTLKLVEVLDHNPRFSRVEF